MQTIGRALLRTLVMIRDLVVQASPHIWSVIKSTLTWITAEAWRFWVTVALVLLAIPSTRDWLYGFGLTVGAIYALYCVVMMANGRRPWIPGVKRKKSNSNH